MFSVVWEQRKISCMHTICHLLLELACRHTYTAASFVSFLFQLNVTSSERPSLTTQL